jgi:hypothetical protein
MEQETMESLFIELPRRLKRKLMGLRKRGITASGHIRTLLEKDFSKKKEGREAA